MGLSSGKTTSKTTSQETGTRTPTNPQWVTDAVQGFAGQIGQFGATNPLDYVAPASQLQQQAWSNAGNLGGWTGQAQTAASLAQQLAGAGANTTGPAAFAAANGYNAQGYAAPTLGSAQGYSAPQLPGAFAATGQGYNPQTMGNVSIAPTMNGTATDATAQSLLTNLGKYMSPYTDQVVDTTLANFDDQSGRIGAAQAAEAAKNKAFGGSRYGIQAAQTVADLARSRASTEAGLRDQAFTVGSSLSADDANRRQAISQFNAANRTGVSQSNAAAANARALAQAGFDIQTGQFNAGAANTAAQFGAGAVNAANLANASARNQFALTQAGLNADAGQFGANANNQFALTRAGLQADASQFGANAANQASQFSAGARNSANQFNAAAMNQNGQFNASQRDAALARQLQAAGLMGDMASTAAGNQRADVTLQGSLGAQQQALAQARAQAPMTQLAFLSELYGGLPFNLFSGQDITGSTSGTNVSKTKPSVFSMLMQAGEVAAKAYAAGAG